MAGEPEKNLNNEKIEQRLLFLFKVGTKKNESMQRFQILDRILSDNSVQSARTDTINCS